MIHESWTYFMLDWTYLHSCVQFFSRLLFSETLVKVAVFIHGEKTVPVRRARLFLERFPGGQSKTQTPFWRSLFPAPSTSQPISGPERRVASEVRVVVQWCEWVTVYGERAAANHSVRLIYSPFLRESAEKRNIVSMTTGGWTVKYIPSEDQHIPSP